MTRQKEGKMFVIKCEEKSCIGRGVVGWVVLHSEVIRARGPKEDDVLADWRPQKKLRCSWETAPGVGAKEG